MKIKFESVPEEIVFNFAIALIILNFIAEIAYKVGQTLGHEINIIL